MSRADPDVAAGTILLALAAACTRLLLTHDYLTYVRPVMAPFLALSATFLLVLAAWTLADALRNPPGQHGAHLPRVAWLLLWPTILITVVAPQSLGAYTAARFSVTAPAPPTDAGGFHPLPAGDPLSLPLDGYVERSAYGGGDALAGRRFSLLGFVSAGPAPDTWYLTRLQIRCCAADAFPLRVLAVGAPPQRLGGWVRITGGYLPVGGDRVARLQVESVEPGQEPTHPYVYG